MYISIHAPLAGSDGLLRRSVREFTDEVVPDALIDKVLDAGLWAAHACNLQSIGFLVLRVVL